MTNLISCLILALVVRHIYTLSKQVEAGSDYVASKRDINTLVTASHIGVTLAYAISQFILLFYKNLIQDYRMTSAFVFFGGLSDFFLSLMLWFILDGDKESTVLVDGDRVYSIIEDVINPTLSVISDDCVEDDDDDNISSRDEPDN